MTDSELTDLLKKGSEKAYGEVFRMYYPVLFRFATAMLKDQSEGEDVVQNAFVKLWMKKDGLAADTNIKAWLYATVKNGILDILRSARVKKRADASEDVLNIPASVHDRLSFIETDTMISRAIATMPPQRRAVFEMSRIRNISNEDIAQRLGLSVRTVEKHLQLAKQDIKSKTC